MGHLVKIHNFNTKYEQDFFHYPNHVTALKKAEWEKLVEIYEKKEEKLVSEEIEENSWGIQKRKKNRLNFPFFKRNQPVLEKESELHKQNENQFVESHHIIKVPVSNIRSKEQLKLLFLEEWYRYQIQLACNDSSAERKRFLYQLEVKQLVQNFSDQSLIFYKPDIQLPDSTIEICTVIVTPLEVLIVNEIKGNKESTYSKYDKRYWVQLDGTLTSKIVNPLISLNRSELIIQNILNSKKINMSVKKVILCKKGYIDTKEMPAGFEYIDKREVKEWYNKNRHMHVPLKSTQLKVGEAILNQTSTNFKGVH